MSKRNPLPAEEKETVSSLCLNSTQTHQVPLHSSIPISSLSYLRPEDVQRSQLLCSLQWNGFPMTLSSPMNPLVPQGIHIPQTRHHLQHLSLGTITSTFCQEYIKSMSMRTTYQLHLLRHMKMNELQSKRNL